ncbi:MAG: radical SAM protein [Deltaproteobacteria bacterium HGW-Deltaproteobacteria-18]|jgi:radical SAM protein with 4Fe4S-binding SPASM domain|nr:MAG: radical SAM protein [Deltaproteobacteria bacterium HGW-Deltaproteobacteria-18]
MTAARSFRFSRVYVEITNICNLRCDFCVGTTRPPASMDPGFFKKVLDQLTVLTDQVCLHVMGEPLLHPHLEAILDICAAAGMKVNLTTNAALLHGKTDMLMRARALRQVNFSMQSLRRGEGPDHDTLDRILEFSLRAADQRPELFINFRLWTLQGLKSGEHNQFNAPILERIAGALDREIRLPQPGRKSARLRDRIYLHTDTVFEWPGDLTTQERSRGFCHALSTHCAILVDGTVCPCCLDADARLALGNLHDDLLTTILDSPRARAMAAGFAANMLAEEVCRHCTYCRRFKSRAQR